MGDSKQRMDIEFSSDDQSLLAEILPEFDERLQLDEDEDISISFEVSELQRIIKTGIAIALVCKDKRLRSSLAGGFFEIQSALMEFEDEEDLELAPPEGIMVVPETLLDVNLSNEQRRQLAELAPDFEERLQLNKPDCIDIQLKYSELQWMHKWIIDYALDCGERELQISLTKIFMNYQEVLQKHSL